MLLPALDQTALQKNAADPKQRDRAVRVERRRNERRVNGYKAWMATPEGRALVWDWMGACRVFGSIWENSARIHYNAGRQDVGHELMADVAQSCPKEWLLMESEARVRQAQEEAEILAGHVRRASDEDEQS